MAQRPIDPRELSEEQRALWQECRKLPLPKDATPAFLDAEMRFIFALQGIPLDDE